MITWIASYPKSGNTWVRLAIAHYHGYSDINGLGPFGFSDVSEWAFDHVSSMPGPYDEFRSYALKPAALLALCVFLSSQHDRVFLKTHAANIKLDGWPQIPVEMIYQAVHIVRDPRDVAVSYSHHTRRDLEHTIKMMNDDRAFTTTDVYKVQQRLASWSTNVESWYNADNTLIVRYEDLGKEGMREVFKFLELNDKKKFDAAVEATQFKVLQRKERKDGFRERKTSPQFFHRGKSGVWKSILTNEQADALVTKHHKMMAKMGYI